MSGLSMRARIAPYAVLATLVLLVATACSGDDDSPDAAQDPVAQSLDGDWTLNAATGLTLDDGNPVTLTIDGDRVSGSSACNRYMGSLTTSGTQVTFGPLGGTEMACSPASVMQLEQDYLAALQAATSAEVDGNTLTVTGPESTLTFLSTAPVVDAELIGTDWLLESLTEGNGNNASASSVTGDPATLTFADDGTVTGSTGVNTFNGSWTQDGESITITDLGMTLIGSTGPAARQEAQVLGVLDGTFTATVSGDVLTLGNDTRKGLVYRQQ
ncbi:META domain-containing protein [Nocardioides sp.]|uniref:META domain-containing protein n=1 Tax=Nocardioides sp. TaxID=35761 RepID=UPI003D0D4732